MRRVVAAARAGEWWEHKLGPILGTGFATSVLGGFSILSSLGEIVLVLAALIPGAVYVSVLNDVTDRRVDALAGKSNRLAGWSRPACAALLAASVATGLAVALLAWRHAPLLLALYAAPWIAFALYSLPGPRLKARGAAGVLADAAGAHVFPHLLIAAAVFNAHGRPLQLAWGLAVGGWAASSGVRFALWHQLHDEAADRRAGVRTFAGRRPELARWTGRWVAFPLELLTFAFMLILARGVIAAVLLPLYAVLEVRRTRRWRARIVVVGTADRYRLAMHEYYVSFYPLAFLWSSTLNHPRDAVALFVVLALTPHTTARILGDLARELRGALAPALVRAR